MDNSLPFERLSDNHVFLPFDCGDEDINDFLLTQAVHYQKELLAVTYLLEDGFMFMGSDERLRYESKTAATVAMYYDLKQINV